ncbi:MAG: PAS domain S-box protein [Microcoleus vaginatus WJT46-NPBG5]|nr:PAS domain S-box protein [Microcoleus vaginatus WJT46-NPBG5]
MNKHFKKLLVPRHLEYLIIGGDWIILDISPGVGRFADCPDEVKPGKDVRTGFPELIGTEEILTAVLQAQQESFELKGIGRFSELTSPFYLDFYVNEYTADEESFETKLIIFFEDVTDKMLLEQRLVQSTNESNLLVSALSHSKKYNKQIITSMADALIVTTFSGAIKTINKAAQNLFKYGEEELIGQPISRIIADRNFLNLVFQEQLLSNGELLKDIEVVCHTKAGQKIFVEFSCSGLQTDIENLKDFLYIGRDITERQRTQQRWGAQYATARILSESATLEQAIPKILLAICESVGWTVGELWMVENEEMRMKHDEKILTSHLVGVRSQLLRCVEIWSRPAAVSAEFIAVSKQTTFAFGVGLPGRVWANRSPHWISDVAKDVNFLRSQLATRSGLHAGFGFPIFSNAEVLGVMAFFSREVQQPDEDLLQTMAAIGSQLGQFIKRKRAEAALSESEERYRELFENASDLIQSVTADGHFIYVNRAWQETLGYSQAGISELTVFDIIHPDCKAQWLQIFNRVSSGEKIERFQAAFLSKNGKKISVEGNVNCKFVEGKPVAIRAIFRDITERLQAEAELRQEREQTERLLLNILPAPIAERLKHEPSNIAENFAEVTVMFADIVGFTQIASYLSPIELVDLLNQIFSAFDRLSERHGLEKIKTIGDAYMVVGGLPNRRGDHAQAIAAMALDMQRAVAQFNQENNQAFSIRIGIHSGPVVAGVIGIKKFIYDLWGDTVNIASRMESHGLAGQIQVSDFTYQLLQECYVFEERGTISVKGKGEMNTYFLLGRKDQNSGEIANIQGPNSPLGVREVTQRLVEQIEDKLRETFE